MLSNKYENFDPNDPACLPQFLEMVQEYEQKYLIDRDTALRHMVSIGICTPEGTLTKEYGG
ncbi:MAG TPA: hypothetical protein VK665_08910 [Candidatus Elarobacter sp.]|nr:hypothetical protein [Candidatus Elarobacter sp.]